MQLCNCHKRYKNIEPNQTPLIYSVSRFTLGDKPTKAPVATGLCEIKGSKQNFGLFRFWPAGLLSLGLLAVKKTWGQPMISPPSCSWRFCTEHEDLLVHEASASDSILHFLLNVPKRGIALHDQGPWWNLAC